MIFDGEITEVGNFSEFRTPSRTSITDTLVQKKRFKKSKDFPEMVFEEVSSTLRSLNTNKEKLGANESK